MFLHTDRQTDKEQTGFPSIDMPWKKHYKKGIIEKALNTPNNKSIYRFYMEYVFTKPDFPVIKYFNTVFTSKQFVELIEIWAKAFLVAGVAEDEMVPVYGTWSPEIAAAFFALNAIGAHPYFEKLEITESALRTETVGAHIGIVFEPLWNDVAKAVFGEERFEKVFMVGLSDSMGFPLKQLLIGQSNRFRKSVPQNGKYISNQKVKDMARACNRPFEVPFKKNRIALITTSSGTTSDAIKGIMDTNESALANTIGTAYAEPGFFPGRECLVTLPPTASTAINCFFLLPLYMGLTVRIDPRADENNWPKLLLKYKPSVTFSTGSLWYSFFRTVAAMQLKGKKVDLGFLDTPIMGGSGVSPEQLKFMNDICWECGAPHSVVSGYGCSEFFGVITVEKYDVDHKAAIEDVISVGIPIPGAVVGIFDEFGNELSYGKRGEIRAKGPSRMHGYFGKAALTNEMFDGDWLKTGDLGEMDEDGYIYCYGRMKSSVVLDGGRVYLFDIANQLRHEADLEDCMLEIKHIENGMDSIVVYYVQKVDAYINEKDVITKMENTAKKYGITIDGYREFKEALPISPTTLKPKTRYLDGFFKYSPSGSRTEIFFAPSKQEGTFKIIHDHNGAS